MSTGSASTVDAVADAQAEEKFDLGGTKDFGFLPIPKRLRYDSRRPFQFTTLLNVIFGVASTCIVANLYYCQPLLIQLSESFDVSYDEVSRIPTLVQAGYATGLLLISPLGDLIRRRLLLLILVTLSATLTIGLCLTHSVVAFEVISFLVGATSVTPQVLIPFAADLAPPNRRGSAVSVVLSGLLLGILIARVLAGIVAQFVSWRIVFFLALGLQYTCLLLLYLVIPDYPAKTTGLTYFGILGTMAKLAVTEPVLIQACLISIAGSAQFSSFWVTLTFLLGGPLYSYSTLDIGLFGLVGMFGVMMAPLTGRIVDRLVPWVGTLVAVSILVLSQALETGIGGVTVAGPIISCFGLDLGRQMQQVSLVTNVYAINPSARSRLNAVVILSVFLGQVMGTSVGAKVYNAFGWRANAALSLGWGGWQLFVLFLRGPHSSNRTWIGWDGGWDLLRRRTPEQPEVSMQGNDSDDSEKGQQSGEGEAANGSEKVLDEKRGVGAGALVAPVRELDAGRDVTVGEPSSYNDEKAPHNGEDAV